MDPYGIRMALRFTKSTLRSKRSLSVISASLLVALSIAIIMIPSPRADNPAGLGFLELDGNVVPGSCVGPTCTSGTGTCAVPISSASSTDWACLFKQTSIFTGATSPTAAQIAAAYMSNGLPKNAVASSFVPDGYNGGPLCPAATSKCPDPTTFTSGSKDVLDISANTCAASNNLLSKDDLVNTYGIKYINPADGHQIAYIGDEKVSNGGDNNIGVWFDQEQVGTVVSPCPGGSGTPFTGNHSIGDILTVSNFTKGGVLAGINAYRWVGEGVSSCPSGTTGSPPLCLQFSGNVCSPGASSSQFVCGTVSSSTICGFPWVTESKELGGQNNTLSGLHCTAVDSFYEMGIDLTALGFTSCRTTAVPETRSSQSLTATLFDFTLLNLNSCQTTTTTSASQQGIVTPGTTVTDTATVTASSPGAGAPAGTVQFYTCGPFASTPSFSNCDSSKSALDGAVALTPATSASATATSTGFSPTQPGYYCFEAAYTPASSGGFLASSSTDLAKECFVVVASKITTSVSPSTIAFGGSSSDTATVTLTLSSATVQGTVDFSVYGPVSTNTPACTTLAKSFTGVAIGPGTGSAAVASPSFTPSSPGYYFWIAKYNPATSANGNSSITSCGDTGETLLVVQASITTNVQPSTIALGSSASDTATVKLVPSTQTVAGTVDFTVYGPVATNTPTCSTVAGTFTGIAINGPGTGATANSGSFTPSAPGYYFWIAKYNPTGPANGNSVTTSCGDTGETLLVVKAAITTNVQPATIAFGSSASDTATVTLVPSTQTVAGTVDFTVYGPVATNTPTCSTVAGTFLGVAISGPGTGATANSGSFTPSQPGYYFWIAKYNPTGPANGNSVTTSCGDTGETLLVVQSAITTNVQPSTIAFGGSASDTATVTLVPSTQSVMGTVDFTVYGPVATSTATCTTVAGTFNGIAISGPGTGATSNSGSFTPAAPGYYFWIAKYNPAGPANGNSVTTKCGDTGETLLVVQSAITTSVQPSTIAFGSTASDTATVTLVPSTQTVMGTIDFTFYGPVATNTPTCSAVAGTFSGIAINGPGTGATANSGLFTPAAPGYYFWIAKYNPSGPANGNSVTTSCGDTGETLLVVQSAIATNVQPPVITFGQTAKDTATVTLSPTGQTVSGTVDFFVYGPVPTNTPTCSALAQSFLGIVIGPGVSPQSISSGDFKPTAPGFYFWTATYHPTGPANGNSVSTTCGDSGETLQVLSIPKITAFNFTNTPTNNDPTTGTGTVTYSVTIHNYGAQPVTLSGSITIGGTAAVTCTGGNTMPISGTLAAGADKTFNMTCNYSGTSGQTVSATVNAMFTDLNNVTGSVSGSPTTYIFTIQTQ